MGIRKSGVWSLESGAGVKTDENVAVLTPDPRLQTPDSSNGTVGHSGCQRSRVRNGSCEAARVWVSIGPSVNGEDLKRVSERDSVEGGAPRVAASSYLNTAPLVWSFARGQRRGEVELVTDTAPARCADMLARGQVEAALVPVIEYQRLP